MQQTFITTIVQYFVIVHTILCIMFSVFDTMICQQSLLHKGQSLWYVAQCCYKIFKHRTSWSCHFVLFATDVIINHYQQLFGPLLLEFLGNFTIKCKWINFISIFLFLSYFKQPCNHFAATKVTWFNQFINEIIVHKLTRLF